MNFRERFSRFERFQMNWRRLLAQGMVILFMGASLVLVNLLRSDAVILMAQGFSWLPMSGIVILSLGLLECLDAFLAKEQRDFFQNLQVGVLDMVIGGLILFSVGGEPARLSLMIAAFLVVRGIVRITLVYAMRLPNTRSTSLSGLASIAMGILIVQKWPTDAGWFLSLCLNLEIAFRGWALMAFALWVRKQKTHDPESLT
jgi:uncharacterized membrane protein HdeD (DUF308 family)